MRKRGILITFLFLFGLIQADMVCMGASERSMGQTLNILCATKPSSSTCTANVSTPDGTYIKQYPEYPDNTLQEFKQPYSTSDDGQVQVSIFLDDKTYIRDLNYSATITCFDSSDNSTNSTTMYFTPTNYQSNSEWIIGVIEWFKKELPILFFIFLGGLFMIGVFLLLIRSSGII